MNIDLEHIQLEKSIQVGFVNSKSLYFRTKEGAVDCFGITWPLSAAVDIIILPA